MNESRRFLSTAIASGLDFEVLSPSDVFEHITMDVLAHHLPIPLKTRLLTASLSADSMSAMLILDTLGVDAIAEHAPVHLLWQCVAAGATRSLGRGAAVPAESTAPDGASPVVAEMPLAAPSKKRKPNRSARASRVRAGATSRSPQASTPAAPVPDSDDSAFEVDTRVGADPSMNSLDDTFDPSDEVTSHGPKS